MDAEKDNKRHLKVLAAIEGYRTPPDTLSSRDRARAYDGDVKNASIDFGTNWTSPS